MKFHYIAGIAAALLMLAYVTPIIIKLQNFALTVVVLIGVSMMLIDLWQSLQSKDR